MRRLLTLSCKTSGRQIMATLKAMTSTMRDHARKIVSYGKRCRPDPWSFKVLNVLLHFLGLPYRILNLVHRLIHLFALGKYMLKPLGSINLSKPKSAHFTTKVHNSVATAVFSIQLGCCSAAPCTTLQLLAVPGETPFGISLGTWIWS